MQVSVRLGAFFAFRNSEIPFPIFCCWEQNSGNILILKYSYSGLIPIPLHLYVSKKYYCRILFELKRYTIYGTKGNKQGICLLRH